MNKEAIVNFLSNLNDYSTESDDLRESRRRCNEERWDCDTFRAVKQGIILWHNKPSMLNDYINKFKGIE